MSDPVRDYLRKKGCPDHVINGGLAGLVETWEGIVESVAEGYSLGLDDYLNDLDVRQLLEESLAVATATEKNKLLDHVNEADDSFKALVTATEQCLWGNKVAKKKGWTPKKNWWYFNRPLNAGEDLLAELTVK